MRSSSDTMLDPCRRAAGVVSQGEIFKQSPKFPPCKPPCQLYLDRGRSKRVVAPPSPCRLRLLSPGGCMPLQLVPLLLLLLRLGSAPSWGLSLRCCAGASWLWQRCGCGCCCGCSCGCGRAAPLAAAVAAAAASAGAILAGAHNSACRGAGLLRQAYADEVATRSGHGRHRRKHDHIPDMLFDVSVRWLRQPHVPSCEALDMGPQGLFHLLVHGACDRAGPVDVRARDGGVVAPTYAGVSNGGGRESSHAAPSHAA